MQRATLLVLLAFIVGCTHLEHLEEEYDPSGKLTWRWRTEGSTFIGMKSVEWIIDEKSEAAQLAGKGISDNFRDVALRAIDTSPELAAAIVRAFRPGGTLEGALAETVEADPLLGAAIRAAVARQEAREAIAAAREAAAAVEPEE
jgi:hypothetical protein